jgi:hypothetical protein
VLLSLPCAAHIINTISTKVFLAMLERRNIHVVMVLTLMGLAPILPIYQGL